jgi:hypothetical protein
MYCLNTFNLELDVYAKSMRIERVSTEGFSGFTTNVH